MKKIILVCSIIFNTLAIIGAVYVLSLKGTINAGYAVVPWLLAWRASQRTMLCLIRNKIINVSRYRKYYFW